MKLIDSHILIQRKGTFDLQGFKPKIQRLPALNFSKTRSITPDFNPGIFSSTSEAPSIFPITPEHKSPKTFEKPLFPTDLSLISSLLKPINADSFLLIHDFKPAPNRQQIINLEKWFFEALEKNQPDVEPVFSLCFQELVSQISVQCHNRARVLVLLFNNFKEFWKGKVAAAEKSAKIKQEEINQQVSVKFEKLQSELDFFKGGMNEYLNKFVRTDERNMLLSRESEILKQIILRFQQEYKLQPINFSKICELIIEDLVDNSKRTQTRIVNSILPKYCKSANVQTIETKIVKYLDKGFQFKPKCKDAQVGEIPVVFEKSSQTYPIKKPKKIFQLVAQGSIRVLPRAKSVQMNPGVTIKKSRLNFIRAEKLLPTNVLAHSKENEFFFPADSSELKEKYKSDTEILSISLTSPYQRRNSHISNTTPLDKPQNQSQNSQKLLKPRSYTPRPYKKPTTNRQFPYKSFQKAKDILSLCLKTSPRILINEATMSMRTLLKTVESMFYSCIPNLRLNSFKGFLEHVYGRLTNKYSLKRMKERRLRDLIASSLRFKDLLIPKLFLRSIGAGSLIGLSNYSIHSLKIILQVLSHFNTHTFSSPLFTFHGRKMCQKSRVLDFIRELFVKRLDSVDYLRVIHQVEMHSEVEHHTNRGPLVEIEWAISYLVYTFDAFEKQVLTGVYQVMEAITLSDSTVFPSKAEVFMAIRAIYPDAHKIIGDQSTWKIFPFLNPRVSEKSLISVSLFERFCMFRGLFKAKHVSNFKKSEVKEIDELEIDELEFMLDGISDEVFQNSISKEDWQKKLEVLRDYREADFAFAIFKKEIQQIVNLFKNV